MRRAELFSLYKRLPSLKDLKGVKLAYTIVRNTKKLEEEINIYQELFKPSEKFLEFEEKRIELCNKFCDKNEEGKPIINNGVYQGVDKNNLFIVEYERLKNEYVNELKERDDQIKKMNEFLSEEINFDFLKIKLEDVPNDISVDQMAVLEHFLFEEKQDEKMD